MINDVKYTHTLLGETMNGSASYNITFLTLDLRGPVRAGDFVVERMGSEERKKHAIPRNARGVVTRKQANHSFRVAWQNMETPTSSSKDYYTTVRSSDQVQKYIPDEEIPDEKLRSDPRMLLGGKPKYETHARDADWWIKHVCFA